MPNSPSACRRSSVRGKAIRRHRSSLHPGEKNRLISEGTLKAEALPFRFGALPDFLPPKSSRPRNVAVPKGGANARSHRRQMLPWWKIRPRPPRLKLGGRKFHPLLLLGLMLSYQTERRYEFGRHKHTEKSIQLIYLRWTAVEVNVKSRITVWITDQRLQSTCGCTVALKLLFVNILTKHRCRLAVTQSFRIST